MPRLTGHGPLEAGIRDRIGTVAPTRRAKRRQDRISELLEAALVLFARKGFDAASMEEIGALAGVSKATVHLYFGRKEYLFMDALRNVMEPILQVGAVTADEWRSSTSSLLRHLLLAWHDIAKNNRVGEILKLMLAGDNRFPVLTQQRDALIQRAHTLIRSVIERGVRSGEFRCCDAAATAHVLLAPLGFRELGKLSNGAFGEAKEPDANYFSTYLNLVLHGLGGHAQEPTGKACMCTDTGHERQGGGYSPV